MLQTRLAFHVGAVARARTQPNRHVVASSQDGHRVHAERLLLASVQIHQCYRLYAQRARVGRSARQKLRSLEWSHGQQSVRLQQVSSFICRARLKRFSSLIVSLLIPCF